MFQERPRVPVLFALVLLIRCGPAEPPLACTDAIGCVEVAPGEPVNLLLTAIETVAVQEEDGTLHIGRQVLRDALYATSGYRG
jgi:hypothetical protein